MSQNDKQSNLVSFTAALLNVIHANEIKSTEREKQPSQGATNKPILLFAKPMTNVLKKWKNIY